MAIMRSRPVIAIEAGMADGIQAESLTPTGIVPAASNVNSKPEFKFAAAGILLVLLGAIAGWIIFLATDPTPFRPASDYSVFAGLFVVAAAVERLLEPFSRYVNPDTDKTKKELEAAVVEAKTNTDRTLAASKSKAAANRQAQLGRERSEKAFLLWGMATLVATLLCAGFGFFMLRAVSAEPALTPQAATGTVAEESPASTQPQGRDPNRFLDLVVTGLVVGAGTKPLHDLITRFEKKKEKEEDPPETNG